MNIRCNNVLKNSRITYYNLLYVVIDVDFSHLSKKKNFYDRSFIKIFNLGNRFTIIQ